MRRNFFPSRALFRLLVPAALCACSTDPSNDAGSAPIDQCNALMQQYCATITDCSSEAAAGEGGAAGAGGEPSQDGREDAIADCEKNSEQVIDCSRATGVEYTYDACMDELGTLECGAVSQSVMDGSFMLPASCNGVIIVE
ncbi:MAG TPA: hypothetical protein VGQ57_18430 [Polyangiaceae bacterium]|jgi:hypothetical protein|nr:hypothetical protein [Polyangiaceae bacterium]